MAESTSTPNHKPKRILLRLTLVLASFVSALAVAEWYLYDLWPVGRCILGLDEELLYRTIPNSAHIQYMSEHVGGDEIIIRINSDGFRGPEIDAEQERPRWIVFGDSFVMGENEPYESTFPARLARHWKDEREVLSAGVSGFGPDQTLMLMEEMLPKYKPEGAVLVLCSYNDLGDPLRNHLMHIDEQGQLTRSRATMNAQDRNHFEANFEEAQKPGLVRLWKTTQTLRNRTKPPRPDPMQFADYLRAHREDYTAHALNGETVAHAILRDIYDADVAIHPEWPSSKYKAKLMGLILGEIRQLFEEAGIPLYVLVAPAGIDLDPESWLRIDPKRYPSYRNDRLCETLTEISRDAGLTTLNLFPEFAARCTTEDLFVGALDNHWNARGMNLGAQLCKEFIQENSK